jgi:hypothetical protein
VNQFLSLQTLNLALSLMAMVCSQMYENVPWINKPPCAYKVKFIGMQKLLTTCLLVAPDFIYITKGREKNCFYQVKANYMNLVMP